jgi:hypothetical protein
VRQENLRDRQLPLLRFDEQRARLARKFNANAQGGIHGIIVNRL